MQTTHKQPWECPAITPAALPMHQQVKKNTRQRKTPAFTEQPHFVSEQMFCWGCAASEYVSVPEPLQMFAFWTQLWNEHPPFLQSVCGNLTMKTERTALLPSSVDT